MTGTRPQSAAETSGRAVNEVLLVGRVSGEPTTRALPSGDELTSWRLVVDRDGTASAATGRRVPTVDTIDCVAHRRAIQRLVARWVHGDVVEVRGSLRRRFWRDKHGAASRCEVEVTEARKAKPVAAGGRR